MMELIYVRHGETAWNEVHLLQGWSDIPLNETGIRQAEKTRELLADISFDRIVTSPLLRAKQTAEIIAEGRGVPLIVDERLKERGFGSLEGHPFDQDDFNSWWKRGLDCAGCGMEPVESLLSRVADLIDVLRQEHPDETILFVSHGGAFVGVDSYFNGFPGDDETLRFIPNCTVRRFHV